MNVKHAPVPGPSLSAQIGAQLRVASTEERIATIAELCRRGFASQMVLSHDAACHFLGVPLETIARNSPEWHFLTIPNHVLPELERLGVTADQITAMVVDNPRRIFEAQEAY